MAFDLQGFENRHPTVRSILRAVTVDSIDHAAAVALRIEDAAKQLAVALPDGPVLEELLTGLQAVQTRAVGAVHALFAPSDVNGSDSTGDPGRNLISAVAAEPPAAPAAAAPQIPGQHYPITWPGPDGPGPVAVTEDQAPVPDPAPAAPAEPVGDSGPLGAVHAVTEEPAIS